VKGKGEETLAARMLRKANMLRKKNVTHNIRESGEQYRAKGRTQGDLNIPGRAAPHAFVQLNPMVESLLPIGSAEEEQRKGFGNIRVFGQQEEDGNTQRSRVKDQEVKSLLGVPHHKKDNYCNYLNS
jgi:hypothetical protein